MPTKDFDKKHLNSVHDYSKKTGKAFGKVIDDISKIAEDPKAKFQKSFKFAHNPAIEAAVNTRLEYFAKELESIVSEGVETEWALSNEKNDALVRRYIRNAKALELAQHLTNHNFDALKTFAGRQVKGMNLSDRVWNISNQLKYELETHIGIGIMNGDSAGVVSRRVRQYLEKPDALFRMVRDKDTDRLFPSGPMKAYSPGQGVYKSAYKNAMRLTRTEINMAYRESDHLRWNQMDFVVGYEVKLSNNHPATDICDSLKGKYPKDFKFVGWHPQCLCHAVPIMLSDEEFDDYIDSILEGEEYQPKKSKKVITDVPDNFKKWLKDNNKRMEGWKSTPYFIRDNKKFVNKVLKEDLYDGFIDKLKKNPVFTEDYPVFKRLMKDRDLSDFSNLDEFEQFCIYKYTTSFHKGLNDYMWKQKINNPYYEAYDYVLRHALKKCKKVEGITFRGTGLNDKLLRRYKGSFEHNGVLLEKGFYSTSKDVGVARNFAHKGKDNKCIFVVQGKTGVNIQPLSHFQNEKEVLFNSMKKYKVIGFEDLDDLYKINLIEI